MEKIIASPRLRTDPVSREIIEHLEANEAPLGLAGTVLYYDFPLFRDYEFDLFRPSLVLLTKGKGVVAVNVAETAMQLREEDDRLSQFHSLLFARLIASKRLRRSRNELALPLNTILFVHDGQGAQVDSFDNDVCTSLEGLSGAIAGIASVQIEPDQFSEARSVIEGIKALAKSKPREIAADGSKPKANVLRHLEDEIANFDSHQRRAAISVIQGPQRIRGLAGSGKTIVLAWKAAHLHLTYPDKKILFTFYTKSLYDLIRRQITKFYRHFRDSDPNWEALHVHHAWGGRNEAGVYYNACLDAEVIPKTFGDARQQRNPFAFVCEDLIKRAEIKSKYDFILIDEAQDMPEPFFQLCFFLAKGDRDSKSLVWAYDELQSIFDVRMRSPRDMFGLDADGQPRVDLERAAVKLGMREYFSNDIVLYKCYRNPREVLVCSHALGFGLYGEQIVQMLENRDHWNDIGYEVLAGDFVPGSQTDILRPEKNSPLSILRFEQKANVIQWREAANLDDEVNWICEQIQQAIVDGLRPEDVLVISLDDRNAKSYFKEIGAKLAARNVEVHDLLSNPFFGSAFSVEGRVTLSTVHRAKGNEAAIVFALGVDAIAPERRSRRGRNKLFTAFTRTKGWLRVSGVGLHARGLLGELATAFDNSPHLRFEFPDPAAVETIQRDISKKEEQARKVREKYVREMTRLGYTEEEMMAELWTEPKK